MHYLDRTAGRALSQFQPLLQITASQLARLHFELTTLPARNTLLASGIGLLVTLISLRFTPAIVANSPFGSSETAPCEPGHSP